MAVLSSILLFWVPSQSYVLIIELSELSFTAHRARNALRVDHNVNTIDQREMAPNSVSRVHEGSLYCNRAYGQQHSRTVS